MGEPGVHAGAIGAVTIQVEPGGAAEAGWPPDQTDRYPGAVRRRRPFPAYLIAIGAERPLHRGLFQGALSAAGQMQCADLGGTVKRFIAQTDLLADILLATLHV